MPWREADSGAMTAQNAPWLSIVGIGEDGLGGLTAPARTLVDDAEVLIGGARHLAMLPDDDRERLSWPSPLSTLLDEIESRRGTRVCVLRSEEHTSELQSLMRISYAVFCLKKKTHN